MGHTIQVGAFAKLDNAVRLMQKLDALGLDAYYYRHADGLYKVRFGDYPSRKEAASQAARLRKAGVIEAYYLVAPGEYAAARFRHYEDAALRRMLVSTAQGFLGIAYEWGGESAETGFDCSGLTMTTYKLNGLNLPRNSRAQFQAGIPVDREDLAPGDLVFFATNGNSTVSHVGIYTGNGRFIHAPKKGETIRQSSLRNGYYEGCYLGARTYLGKDG
ncbi:MAG: C40 family peptidase [Proteobacteria bacterium]|nr:C40 family peptidase [Pseudomonadota bacterium]MBU1546726.1 C40 family peptidase [Pseudomonadota bacterium]MBU2618531.1 C40 family peptidase [Pseudomonadota bacterium]